VLIAKPVPGSNPIFVPDGAGFISKTLRPHDVKRLREHGSRRPQVQHTIRSRNRVDIERLDLGEGTRRVVVLAARSIPVIRE
jgi:hypothetical protein